MRPSSHRHFLLALAGSSLIAISSAAAQNVSNTWKTAADGNTT